MTYAFNEVFKEMINIFNIEISAISFEVDRHESRVRHWKKDSLPAKSLMVELLPFLCHCFEKGTKHNKDNFCQFMSERGYCDSSPITSKQLMMILETLIKDRIPYVECKLISYKEVLQKTQQYEQKEDYDELIVFCENMIYNSFYELNCDSLAHLNQCIAKTILKHLLVKFEEKEFEKALTLLNYSLLIVRDGSLSFNLTHNKADLLLNEALLTSTLENAYQAVELYRTLLSCQDRLLHFNITDSLAKALNYIGERAGKYKYFEEVLSLRTSLEEDYLDSKHDENYERLYLLNLYGKVNVIAHLVTIANSQKYYALAEKTYNILLQSHFSSDLEIYFQATLLTLSTLNIEFYRLTANEKYLLTASVMLETINNAKEEFGQIKFIYYIYTFSLLSNKINSSNYQDILLDLETLLSSDDFKQVDVQAPQKIYYVYISKIYLAVSIYEGESIISQKYIDLYKKYRHGIDETSIAPQWSTQLFLSDLIFSISVKVNNHQFDCSEEIDAIEQFEQEAGDRKTPIAYAFFQIEKGLFYKLMSHHIDDDVCKVKMDLAFNLAKHSVTELEYSSILNCFKELTFMIDKSRIDEVQSYLFEVPNRVLTE